MQRSPTKSIVSLVTAVLGLGLLFFGGTVSSDTLDIQPEQLSLSKANPIGSLRFLNTSAEQTTLSFNVVQWEQQGDREWLTPSREMIVVPERLTLKPGESGRVRVSLRLSGSFWDEEAFRVMVTERTQEPKEGYRTEQTYKTLTSRPHNVPVFLLPPGKASPRLSWSLKRDRDGGVVLRASNSGKAHVQLNSASLLGPYGQALQKPRMTDILLPGGARSWSFPTDVSAGFWNLIADTNVGPLRVRLELEPGDSTGTALSYSQ